MLMIIFIGCLQSLDRLRSTIFAEICFDFFSSFRLIRFRHFAQVGASGSIITGPAAAAAGCFSNWRGRDLNGLMIEWLSGEPFHMRNG